jgi:DNA-binding transcriptional LysR family regulator
MRTRLPSLNALRFFESAARLGSFKAAAGELCVSRSAVSHQVKKLELQLNVKLFLRKASTLELTRVGSGTHRAQRYHDPDLFYLRDSLADRADQD